MTDEQSRADAPAVPRCYRHPDRETYIRCSRCERPICPDCMVDASVGYQCPECVREGTRGARQARTTFGGRVSQDPGWVSKVLIGINVLVFLLQKATADTVTERLFLLGGFPAQSPQVGVAAGEYYRLLTAAFLHGSLLHLALNMYALYIFGPFLEGVLGRGRFLALYLLAAVGGSVTSYTFSPPTTPSLGASGAIFGLLGAQLVVSRRLRLDASAVYALLAINLALGFVVAGIDYRAHLGGLVVGAVVALLMAYAPRQARAAVQWGGCAALAGVLLVLAALHTSALVGGGVGP